MENRYLYQEHGIPMMHSMLLDVGSLASPLSEPLKLQEQLLPPVLLCEGQRLLRHSRDAFPPLAAERNMAFPPEHKDDDAAILAVRRAIEQSLEPCSDARLGAAR